MGCETEAAIARSRAAACVAGATARGNAAPDGVRAEEPTGLGFAARENQPTEASESAAHAFSAPAHMQLAASRTAAAQLRCNAFIISPQAEFLARRDNG